MGSDNIPNYRVKFKNEEVLKNSQMKFEIENIKDFDNKWEISNAETSTFKGTWEMP